MEVEHLLSECVEAALRAVPAARPARATRRPVLLAALEPEDHRLPLVALAAALAERRSPARHARRPPAGRGRWPTPSRRTGACAVFLWSQGARGPASLPERDGGGRPAAPAVLLLGGPGWAGQTGGGAARRGSLTSRRRSRRSGAHGDLAGPV